MDRTQDTAPRIDPTDRRFRAFEERPRFAGPEFCRELSELTDMDLGTLSSVFAGERTNIALDAVKTVVAENLDKTPEAWTEILQERAKTEGLGEYRPGYWAGTATSSPGSTTSI